MKKRENTEFLPETNDKEKVCTDEFRKNNSLWKIDPTVVSGYHSGGTGRRPQSVRWEQKSAFTEDNLAPNHVGGERKKIPKFMPKYYVKNLHRRKSKKNAKE